MEAYSYIGVELRWIHDQLAELHAQGARSRTTTTATRLAQADGMPLENLDEPLAHAINYATSHRGLYAQAGLWFNPPIAVALAAGAASRCKSANGSLRCRL